MSVSRKLYWVISTQYGLDARTMFLGIVNTFRFIVSYIRFKKEYQGDIELKPCLTDYLDQGGSAQSEYFLQDLYVARQINIKTPNRHIDVGSRIDGFVANVASFREIEVVDIRPMDTRLYGIKFIQTDMMQSDHGLLDCSDSVSCLHALEHFGLGRYGDPISASGYIDGFKNISGIVMLGGLFYLSVPVGIKKVEFNANHVFDPLEINELFIKHHFSVERIVIVRKGGVEDINIDLDRCLKDLSKEKYVLCIFIARKL